MQWWWKIYKSSKGIIYSWKLKIHRLNKIIKLYVTKEYTVNIFDIYIFAYLKIIKMIYWECENAICHEDKVNYEYICKLLIENCNDTN